MDAGSTVVCILILVFMVGIYLIVKISSTGDREVYSKDTELRTDAEIIDISNKIVVMKGEHKFRTVVTFDDGFKFVSHDTDREDQFLGYKISVTEKTNEFIIKKAINAHNCALIERGMDTPQKPFVCGKCGHKGPYDGNCPECGSSLRRFNI